MGAIKHISEDATSCRRAAEQGDAFAQFNLGAAHHDGEGEPKDFAESYFWLRLAALAKAEDLKTEDVSKLCADATSHPSAAAADQTQARVKKWLGEQTPASAGDAARSRDTSVLKRSPWRSAISWLLIVIGLWGGLQNLATGADSIGTLITMVLLIVAGVGLISKMRLI